MRKHHAPDDLDILRSVLSRTELTRDADVLCVLFEKTLRVPPPMKTSLRLDPRPDGDADFLPVTPTSRSDPRTLHIHVAPTSRPHPSSGGPKHRDDE